MSPSHRFSIGITIISQNFFRIPPLFSELPGRKISFSEGFNFHVFPSKNHSRRHFAANYA